MNTFSSTLNDDGILTLTIDVSSESMNIFNQQVIKDFSLIYEDINNNPAIKAVIFISGKKDCFIAGADIKMLQQAQTAMEGSSIVSEAHMLLQKIAYSRKPFIAAIDGICLGAGYELSLACDYRIATNNPKTKIGLPEVMLGLLPGASGTTKLSRLIALPTALDLILTGKQLNATRALHVGMIDEVVPKNILHIAATTVAKKLIDKKIKPKRTSLLQKICSWPLIKDVIINKARQQVLHKTHGVYPAPLAILDLIQQGLRLPLAQALALEAQKFGELSVTPEAKQLINIYFATTELKKESFTSTGTVPTPITQVGILGGGLMGAGIATITIDKANANARIKDIADKSLLSVYQHIEQYYKTRVKRKILSPEQAKKKRNQLTSSLNYDGFTSCDLVIEAVFEDITIKHQMLNDIEELGNHNAIFASNTSSIPISDIAEKAQRPENVIGMHYFSPVEKMPLLEIIKHKGTSDQTIASAVEFGKKQGKTVIVVNDGAGFYVNRILTPYINAALQLAVDGVPFDHIDSALTNFGFPVGPIKLLDEVGIDIGSKIQPILEHAFGERMRSCGIQQTLLDKGRLGKKSGKGFYSYNNKKKKGIDESIYHDLNISQKIDMNEQDIVDRCVYPMLNEAVLCLQEGIIASPRDGDIGAIFGIGFPPFLGGPFRHIDYLGAEHVRKNLHTLEKKHPGKYKAAERIEKMSLEDTSFY